ncbi:MAG: class I SAM-dependent RNA methyltransferase [Rubrivivax sp.]|nr:MAG: class I SAM-dependent RNA methyltransferase [Rubrivivax sp.]
MLFLPCAAGVEPLLLDEITPLLADLPLDVVSERGGVSVHPAHGAPTSRVPADMPFDLQSELSLAFLRATMLLNLHSRLAQRVLWRVAIGSYVQEDHLYHLARSVEWSDWITPRNTLRVDVTARHSPVSSLNFAGLRIKDAVCDHLRDLHGERPDVDTRHPDLSLLLHLDTEVAHLYVDTSGEALFKRGWREDKGEAPLKETLAAAMIAASGWQGRAGDGALLDPCCGSGTIAIEAAQIACGIAAGLLRRFAFERLKPFQSQLPAWQQLKQAAKARVHAPAVPIFAGDVSFRMTDFATRNAERAGVLHAIEFKTADALQRTAPASGGVLMFNPPYGERIAPKGTGHAGSSRSHRRPDQGDGHEARGGEGSHEERDAQRAVPAGREGFLEQDASDFFTRLASHWKRQFGGWTAWVLSPDMKLPSAMRLKESRRVVMFNGPIECRLFRFDLVQGSHRGQGDQAPSAEPPSA